MDVLKTVLPTLASALVSPLAGVAVAALTKLFNLNDEQVGDAAAFARDAMTDPDKLLLLRQVEVDLRKYELENGFRFAELEIRDRESARAREVGTKDRTNKILAFTIIIAFISTTFGVVFIGIGGGIDSALAGTLLGYLSAKAEQVLSYYFGSTAGSRLKTELLYQSIPAADRSDTQSRNRQVNKINRQDDEYKEWKDDTTH